MKFHNLLLTVLLLASLSLNSYAELQDQGLNSIMEIIDKAIENLNDESGDATLSEIEYQNSIDTVVNLSRTLGTLSYSRLQCGEAAVLAEFTQRVQLIPEENRDSMRDAFQEGFDKSKDETELLSQDECERLTRSRNRSEQEAEANVRDDESVTEQIEVVEKAVEALPSEDPKFRHLRIAELTGQLAYKRKFCEEEQVFNRDYNEYLNSVPDAYREEVKTAYWEGYKHGKRLNQGLREERC